MHKILLENCISYSNERNQIFFFISKTKKLILNRFIIRNITIPYENKYILHGRNILVLN